MTYWELGSEVSAMTNKEILEDDVKVVRCNDCIFSREMRTDIEKETYCEGVVMCNNGVWGAEIAMWDDDFCSYGEERK